MDLRWDRCIALSFVTVGLAPSASAQTAAAAVKAEVVSPSGVGETATEWLASNSPGVFTLTIPGAVHSPSITLTASASNTAGTANFIASSESAGAVQNFIAQITASAASGSGGAFQVSSVAADGTMNAQGVQLILASAEQNGDGSGVIVAIMTFD